MSSFASTGLTLSKRVLPLVTASFVGGLLRVIGDDQDNVITVSRDAAAILVNNGAVLDRLIAGVESRYRAEDETPRAEDETPRPPVEEETPRPPMREAPAPEKLPTPPFRPGSTGPAMPVPLSQPQAPPATKPTTGEASKPPGSALDDPVFIAGINKQAATLENVFFPLQVLALSLGDRPASRVSACSWTVFGKKRGRLRMPSRRS
jgi:hypothetical protein